MMSKFKLKISSSGEITAIHNDHLVSLYKDGRGTASIRRASHVEPTSDGLWTADMSPMNGPMLGPFETRQKALDAETDWLKAQLFSS